jgi:hypothetical protein
MPSLKNDRFQPEAANFLVRLDLNLIRCLSS